MIQLCTYFYTYCLTNFRQKYRDSGHSGRSRGTVQSVSVLPGAADSRGAGTAPGARRAVKRQVSGRTATATNGELRGKTPFDQGKETALLR